MVAAPIRIAAAQYPIERFATLGAYHDKLARWVTEAAGNGAELLVFPEYGAMEYAAASGDAVAGDLAASLAVVSDALREMDAAHAELARRHGCTSWLPAGRRRAPAAVTSMPRACSRHPAGWACRRR